MTLISSASAAATLERPALWGIGRYLVGERPVSFPIGRAELERDIAWATDVLDGYGIHRGRKVHIVSGGWESPWYLPFFAAVQRLHATYTIGDIFGFDARRTDLFLRRLTPHLVIGLSADITRGLADGGQLDNLRPVPHVLARPEAVTELRGAGIEAGVFAPVGAATALTLAGGTDLSYATAEWHISATDGELRLSTVGERAFEVSDAPTGVRGDVDPATGRLTLR